MSRKVDTGTPIEEYLRMAELESEHTWPELIAEVKALVAEVPPAYLEQMAGRLIAISWGMAIKVSTEKALHRHLAIKAEADNL